MASRCRVFRGLVKEVEEETADFLATEMGRMLRTAHAETGDPIAAKLIVDPGEGCGEDGR
jgi:hypothetical protein